LNLTERFGLSIGHFLKQVLHKRPTGLRQVIMYVHQVLLLERGLSTFNDKKLNSRIMLVASNDYT
jgi:hypothetical protein